MVWLFQKSTSPFSNDGACRDTEPDAIIDSINCLYRS